MYDVSSHELNHAVQNELWPKAFRTDIFNIPSWPAGQNALKEDFLAQIHKTAKSLMELDSYYLNEENMRLLRQRSDIVPTAADNAILNDMEINTTAQLLGYSADLRATTVGSSLSYDTNNILPRDQIKNGLTELSNYTETFFQNNLQNQIDQRIYDHLMQELQTFRNGL